MTQRTMEIRQDPKIAGFMDKERQVRLPRPAALHDAADTGLPFPLLVDLVLKIIFRSGQLRLWDIKEQTRLPLAAVESILGFMRAERLCEIQGGKLAESEISYGLTDLGRVRATDALGRSQYAGPCPVPLEAYAAQVERQTIASTQHIGREEMRRAFQGVVLADDLLDRVGPALNSGRSIFIYGPSGSGKTYLAERLSQALQGTVWIPYAIAVDSEVIQVFDPLVHCPLDNPGEDVRSLDRHHAYDERWVRCMRPVVIGGGEVTLDSLDLEFDSTSRFYTAPPQVKANNGLFIIDDLGRQRATPRELLNRWVLPMDRRVDYLTLHTGKKFRIPFDVAQVFTTNLPPEELADEAFLRRLGYKIFVGAATRDKYRELVQQACSRLGVCYADEAFHYLADELHGRSGRAFYACYPYDLVSKVRDRALYVGTVPELSPETLEWAWLAYFGHVEPTAESR